MEAFLKIVDDITLLAKSREENKVKLFNEAIDPLYTEFERIAAQYFSFFRLTLEELENSPSDKIVDKLKKQREEYTQARRKIFSMTESMKAGFGQTDILDFSLAIKEFFFLCSETDISIRSLNKIVDQEFETLLNKIAIESDKARNISGASRLVHMIDQMLKKIRETQSISATSEKEANDIFLENVTFYIEDSLNNMEDSWHKVSSTYAKLRINYLTSKNKGS